MRAKVLWNMDIYEPCDDAQEVEMLPSLYLIFSVKQAIEPEAVFISSTSCFYTVIVNFSLLLN